MFLFGLIIILCGQGGAAGRAELPNDVENPGDITFRQIVRFEAASSLAVSSDAAEVIGHLIGNWPHQRIVISTRRFLGSATPSGVGINWFSFP